MIETVIDALAICLLGAGLILATVGLYGLLRMDDVRSQLHAAGLVTGPAVICVLAASIATGNAETITSAALVIIFVLVTSPLAAHAIAQADHRARLEADAGDDASADEPAS